MFNPAFPSNGQYANAPSFIPVKYEYKCTVKGPLQPPPLQPFYFLKDWSCSIPYLVSSLSLKETSRSKKIIKNPKLAKPRPVNQTVRKDLKKVYIRSKERRAGGYVEKSSKNWNV